MSETDPQPARPCVCATCNGRGYVITRNRQGVARNACPTCDGTGSVEWPEETPNV